MLEKLEAKDTLTGGVMVQVRHSTFRLRRFKL